MSGIAIVISVLVAFLVGLGIGLIIYFTKSCQSLPKSLSRDEVVTMVSLKLVAGSLPVPIYDKGDTDKKKPIFITPKCADVTIAKPAAECWVDGAISSFGLERTIEIFIKGAPPSDVEKMICIGLANACVLPKCT